MRVLRGGLHPKAAGVCLNGRSPTKIPTGMIVRDETAKVAIDRRVRDVGLRPTRQRLALAGLLFAKGDRHLSAEQLHDEAVAAGVPVSLATVYNALHHFTTAGLLRILAVVK